jgi:hypothetical protein
MKAPSISNVKGTGSGPAMGAEIGAGLATTLAATLGSALPAALMPISTIGNRIATQIDKVGGVVARLAAKVDASFKLPRAMQEMTTWGLIAKKSIYQAMMSMGRLGKVEALNRTLASDPLTGRMTKSKGMGNAIPEAGNYSKATGGQLGLNTAINQGSAAAKGFGRNVLLSLGVFGLGFKVVQFFKSGINGAVNLNETISKTQEVFGFATASVTKQANDMAKAFGLPKGAMLDAAAAIGLVGKAGGQTDDQAAKLANTMAKLAADSASFFNVPLEDALNKIRSGLVGEAEPLRAFGVLLNETAVAAEAARLGLGRGSKILDERTKVAARASLIERGLAVASGDLARTQDSAANQFKKAGGGIQNFATMIGTALLPAVTTGITIFNDLAATIIETVEANMGAIEAFTSGVQSAFEGVGGFIRNFGNYWSIAGLIVSETVQNIVATVATIPANLGIIGEYIGNNWVKLISDGVNAVGSLFQNLGQNIWDFAKAVFAFLRDPTAGFTFNFTPLLDGFKATADQLPELIKPALISLQDEMGAKFGEIATKEAERAKGLAKTAGAKIKPGPLGDVTKDEKNKTPFAGAFEAGSKDAYSAIVQAQFRQGDKDGIKTVARLSAAQLQVQKDTAADIKKIAAASVVGVGIGAATGVTF